MDDSDISQQVLAVFPAVHTDVRGVFVACKVPSIFYRDLKTGLASSFGIDISDCLVAGLS